MVINAGLKNVAKKVQARQDPDPPNYALVQLFFTALQ